MTERVIIIGGSIFGTFTTTALFRNGFEGELVLIDQEDLYPYDKLPLSKEWMKDEEDMEPPLLKKKEYYEKENIDLRLNTKVESVDWKAKTLTTDKGETISYDQLVIGTGSKLRKLSFPGDDAEGIFYLRSFDQAKEIKEWVKNSKDIAIIGSGFIGLELVSAFSQLGKNVSVLIRSGKPLEKILGEEAADYFLAMHGSHGANFMFGEETEEFIKDDKGKIKAIRTKSGRELKTDMVIVAAGVRPNLSFEIDSLDTDNGTVLVNEYGETSIEDIYAGGDIAKWPYRDGMIHVEHWEIAWSQGRSIAKNIIEKRSNKYDFVPYFWTDQYDQTFEYLGNARGWDRTYIRGSMEDGIFSIAYVDRDEKLLAVLFANKAEKRDQVEKLLRKEGPFDGKRFENVDIAIEEV